MKSIYPNVLTVEGDSVRDTNVLSALPLWKQSTRLGHAKQGAFSASLLDGLTNLTVTLHCRSCL